MIRQSRLILLAALLLVLAGLILVIVLNRSSGAPSSKLESFHFVARVEVTTDLDVGRPPIDRIEGWYEAAGGARWELSYDDPRMREQGTVIVSNGDSRWTYDGPTNSYSRAALTDESRQYPGVLPSFSLLLGPLPADDIASYFDRLPGGDWKIAGHEEVLGRGTQVIELTMEPAGGSTIKLWIDPEFAFVLRYVSGNGPNTVRAEVTELEYGGDLPSSLFKFEPPPGAREMDIASPTRASGSLGNLIAPEGFLSPGYLPVGFIAVGEGSTDSSGRTTSYEIRLARTREGQPELIIEQQLRFGGLPDSWKTGETVLVGSKTGYRSTIEGWATLVWSSGDLVFTVRSTVLPPEELLKVAEGIR